MLHRSEPRTGRHCLEDQTADSGFLESAEVGSHRLSGPSGKGLPRGAQGMGPQIPMFLWGPQFLAQIEACWIQRLGSGVVSRSSVNALSWRIPDKPPRWKVVAERWDVGFLASGGDEFNLGPETRLDRSELLCNKVLLKYKGDRESFWHRHQKGAKEYPYLAFKKGILTHATTWMNFEDIMLSEISESQKDKYCMIPLI